jgi:transposase
LLVVEQLKEDPLSGHLFVFTNGRHNRIGVLYWDGSGLGVCAKRLERGRFTWPVSDHGQVSLRGEEFSALIHGLPSAPGKVGRFWHGCDGRWNWCGDTLCPKVCWAKPLTSR